MSFSKRSRSNQLNWPEPTFKKIREVCNSLVGLSIEESYNILDACYDRLENQSVVVEEKESKQPRHHVFGKSES